MWRRGRVAGGRALYRAREEERDQSYFLFATTREQLDLLRFPLGDKTKAETRELARRFGLAVADKHDSQDICFVPAGRYTDVIERLLPGAAEPGDIVDLDGRVLGSHQGIIHFTVGQRRGLGLATGAPLYVVRLDAARPVASSSGRARRCARNASGCATSTGSATAALAANRDRLEVYVKVRSTRPPQPAWLQAAPTASRSNCSRARTGSRLARPACSMHRPRDRRACSAAVSSGGQSAEETAVRARAERRGLRTQSTLTPAPHVSG